MERGPEIGGVQNDLRRVVDALPGLIWTAQPDGQIDLVNQRWCEYTGLSANEAHGRGWQTAIHPEDLPLLLERWRAILTSGETREMEARLRRFDGEYRKFVLRACPLMEESGRIIRWCGINTDVEGRRRLDAELKLTEARKTAILDSALDCIVTIDHEGCITEFNPAAERTFGYRRDQAMGKQLADLIIPPSLRNQHRQGFARYLATGEARVLGSCARQATSSYWADIAAPEIGREAQAGVVLLQYLQKQLTRPLPSRDALQLLSPTENPPMQAEPKWMM